MKVFTFELWHMIVHVKDHDGQLDKDRIIVMEISFVDQLPSNRIHRCLLTIEQTNDMQRQRTSLVDRQEDFEGNILMMIDIAIDRIDRTQRLIKRIDDLRVANRYIFGDK